MAREWKMENKGRDVSKDKYVSEAPSNFNRGFQNCGDFCNILSEMIYGEYRDGRGQK